MESFENTALSICGRAEQLTPRIRSADSNSRNDVYVGQVVLPGGGGRCRAYVKVFPPEVRALGVYNEVIAHVFAQQCSLPSPFTFPCACDISLLRQSNVKQFQLDSTSQYILGVASVEHDHIPIRQTGSDCAALWADVMNWSHVANLAVFDELLGNDDRHIGNLLRCAPHDYLLIDNEGILFGEDWFHSDLTNFPSRRCDSNIIADSIAEGTDDVARMRMVTMAQRYVMQVQLQQPPIHARLEQLCRAPAGITMQLVHTLNTRRQHLPQLMQWHVSKGDLFKVSSN